jgi:hypothetical protein
MTAPGLLAPATEANHDALLVAIEELAPDHPALPQLRDRLSAMAVRSGKDSAETASTHAIALRILAEFLAAASAAVPAGRPKGGQTK